MGTVSLEKGGDRIDICTLSTTYERIRANGIPDFPRLLISIYVEKVNPTHFPFKILDMVTELCYSNIIIGRSRADEYVYNNRNLIYWTDFEDSYSFDYPLTRDIIDFIENKRQGKELQLKIKVKLKIGTYDKLSEATDKAPMKVGNLLDIKFTSSTDLDVNIPHSYWVKDILPNIGRGKYFLLEIPQNNFIHNKVNDLYEKAKSAYYNWNISDVILNCRKACEELDSYLKINLGEYHFFYEQRWLRAFKGVKDFASIDLHKLDEMKVNKKVRPQGNYQPNECIISKIDAEHLLMRTQFLIKLAVELLAEKP